MITVYWSATFPFTKAGLNDTTPFLFTIARFSIASLLAIILWGKHLKGITKKDIKFGSILGILYGVGYIAQTYGMKYTTASKSAFITGFLVVLTPFAYRLIVKKPVNIWAKIGVVTASIGLYLFTNPDFNAINIGDALTTISAVVWAIYIVYIDVFTKDLGDDFSHIARIVILQFVITALFGVVFQLGFEMDNFKFVPSNMLLGGLAFNIIFASLITTTVQTKAQKFSTPVKAALIFSLEPVFAAYLATAFFGETLGVREYLGGSILLFGVILSETGEFVLNKIKGVFGK